MGYAFSWLLLFVGFVALAIGASTLSQATMGPGLLAGACFFAICARMAQARADHSRLIQAITDLKEPEPTPPPMTRAERERAVARVLDAKR